MTKTGFRLKFPDLPGCLTCGATEAEAMAMAKEALGLHLYGMEVDGDPISVPSAPSSLTLEQNQMIIGIEVWMPALRRGIEQRAIKKTLTIPKWLNDLAEQNRVNFSHLLQDAIKHHLGIKDRL